jgi:hypothetical protein
MTVQDVINIIKELNGYISSSIYLKHYDDFGAVYKFLILVDSNKKITNRYQIFIELNSEDSNLELLEREALAWYYVEPAV